MHEIQKKLLSLASLGEIDKFTYREIAELVGCSHASQVKHHIEQLKKKGLLIIRADGSLIASPGSRYSIASVPVLGEADCGEATQLASDEIKGYLTLSPSILPRRKSGSTLYALKARGASMNQADISRKSIDDGDYILVEKQDAYNPTEGDYIVSVIEGMANVKKFHIDQYDRIILMSESSEDIPPIIIAPEDLHYYQIVGKVVEVIKGVKKETDNGADSV